MEPLLESLRTKMKLSEEVFFKESAEQLASDLELTVDKKDQLENFLKEFVEKWRDSFEDY